jgi:hypothetical protein
MTIIIIFIITGTITAIAMIITIIVLCVALAKSVTIFPLRVCVTEGLQVAVFVLS